MSLEATLDQLSDFIKQTDISQRDTPVGISLSTSGLLYIRYSLSQSPVTLSSARDANTYLKHWLAANLI